MTEFSSEEIHIRFLSTYMCDCCWLTKACVRPSDTWTHKNYSKTFPWLSCSCSSERDVCVMCDGTSFYIHADQNNRNNSTAECSHSDDDTLQRSESQTKKLMLYALRNSRSSESEVCSQQVVWKSFIKDKWENLTEAEQTVCVSLPPCNLAQALVWTSIIFMFCWPVVDDGVYCCFFSFNLFNSPHTLVGGARQSKKNRVKNFSWYEGGEMVSFHCCHCSNRTLSFVFIFINIDSLSLCRLAEHPLFLAIVKKRREKSAHITVGGGFLLFSPR